MRHLLKKKKNDEIKKATTHIGIGMCQGENLWCTNIVHKSCLEVQIQKKCACKFQQLHVLNMTLYLRGYNKSQLHIPST